MSDQVYSFLDEQNIIKKYCAAFGLMHYCVDIGASDGVSMSNSFSLYHNGWGGLAIECNPQKFPILAQNLQDTPLVNIVRGFVTPENVINVLRGFSVPEKFGVLSLDIDGYDYFVLDKLLSQYRPGLICAEINEKIPPPIKFTVNWDKNYFWSADHFYGQSISQIEMLCIKHNYNIVELEYCDVFLVPNEINIFNSLSAEEAYREGYQMRSDRQQKFPWNVNMEPLLTMQPEEGLNFIKQYFSKYDGKFTAML